MKTLLTLLFCLMPLIVSAEQFYVYIDKKGIIPEGQEAGCTAYEDIVAIHPATKQYEPTRAELDRYHIVEVDLTREERAELLKPILDYSEIKEGTYQVDNIDYYGLDGSISWPDLMAQENPDFEILSASKEKDIWTIHYKYNEFKVAKARQHKVDLVGLDAPQKGKVEKSRLYNHIIVKPSNIHQ